MRSRRIFSMLIVVMLGFLSGCLNGPTDAAPSTPGAGLAFVHGAAASPSLSVIMDNRTINSSTFNYFAFSGYVNIDPGTHPIRFSATSDLAALHDTTMTFQANNAYSLFLYNKGSKLKSFVTRDEAIPFVNSNTMMVRVVHLSPDLPEVKVALVGESRSIAEQVDFTEVSPFSEFTAKSSTVEVRSLTDGHVIATQTFDPVARQYLTIALMGFVTPPSGNTNKLAVKVIIN